MNLPGRIAAEAVVSECEKQETSEYLQIETVLMVGDEIHHETHAERSRPIAYGLFIFGYWLWLCFNDALKVRQTYYKCEILDKISKNTLVCKDLMGFF